MTAWNEILTEETKSRVQGLYADQCEYIREHAQFFRMGRAFYPLLGETYREMGTMYGFESETVAYVAAWLSLRTRWHHPTNSVIDQTARMLKYGEEARGITTVGRFRETALRIRNGENPYDLTNEYKQPKAYRFGLTPLEPWVHALVLDLNEWDMVGLPRDVTPAAYAIIERWELDVCATYPEPPCVNQAGRWYAHQYRALPVPKGGYQVPLSIDFL